MGFLELSLLDVHYRKIRRGLQNNPCGHANLGAKKREGASRLPSDVGLGPTFLGVTDRGRRKKRCHRIHSTRKAACNEEAHEGLTFGWSLAGGRGIAQSSFFFVAGFAPTISTRVQASFGVALSLASSRPGEDELGGCKKVQEGTRF